ncbi:MAG TPA: hypothetical protein DHV85_08135 [Candidatus Accumulibacter sp.]|nr:hypothetical protein [Accumulibacter sp.]
MGKTKKSRIERAHIDAETPLHWGYVFDQVMQKRGGFDIVLTNPPWEVFKPQAKEFFADHSELVTKNKMTIKEFEKEQGKLLKDEAVREAWLAYESHFPHLNQYFRRAPEYRSQFATVDGRKVGSDLNLYKLFLERCFSLLRPGGHCGIVIPSGIYTDLGAKGLRDLLFNRTRIEGLFCFENRKTIFEGVHRSFKFVVLTFEKTASLRVQQPGEKNVSAPPDDLLSPARTGELGTTRFPAAFMRWDVTELDRFPAEGALWLDVNLIRRLSPDSHSVMEFKTEQDIHIAEKMLHFPLLGEHCPGAWKVSLCREFHMTDDAKLFKTDSATGRLPLFEGKMIWQFNSAYAEPRYWVNETEGKTALLRVATRRLTAMLKVETGLTNDLLDSLVDESEITLDSSAYRLGFRDIAANTNERTMICSILPPNVFAGNTINLIQPFEFVVDGSTWKQQKTLAPAVTLFACGVFNSFVIDWLLRQKITSHLNMFYVYQVPIPRLKENAPTFSPIVTRAAQLTCTTPEFDALAREVGLEHHQLLDPIERARLRAELDGLVAHLYGLSEAEFALILASFPLVPEPVKVDAHNAYRRVAQGLIT